MKLHRAYEKRDWGSGKLTWRAVLPVYRKGTPIAYSLRRVTNRKVKHDKRRI